VAPNPRYELGVARLKVVEEEWWKVGSGWIRPGERAKGWMAIGGAV